VSAFVPETLNADRRAFAALLQHLKTVDAKEETVVMVQVENEVGMLPSARDHGEPAEAAFRQPVPAQLVTYLVRNRERLEPELRTLWEGNGAKRSGSWNDLFGAGDAAAELFTAWHYARFIDALAVAGKAAYGLPMYVNVALNRPGKAPGEYPSGGPVPHLIDVWKAGAPSIDLIAPDIYFANFVDIVGRYKRPDNPVFIPEAQYADRPEAPANGFYAFGEADAIGFSPFSIDSIDDKPDHALARAYDVLRQLEPAILAAQGTGRMAGFKPRLLYDEKLVLDPVVRRIGDYRFTVAFTDNQAPNGGADTASRGGLIIQIGPEDYLIAGQGITVTFEPVTGSGQLAGIDSAWEGRFDSSGAWVPGRLLNGDQTHQGRHIRLPAGDYQIQRLRLYRYQ
jgi:beta-galactosidase GanA